MTEGTRASLTIPPNYLFLDSDWHLKQFHDEVARLDSEPENGDLLEAIGCRATCIALAFDKECCYNRDRAWSPALAEAVAAFDKARKSLLMRSRTQARGLRKDLRLASGRLKRNKRILLDLGNDTTAEEFFHSLEMCRKIYNLPPYSPHVRRDILATLKECWRK